MSTAAAASNPSLASLAVQNPLFQSAAKQAVFQAVQQEEGDNDLLYPNTKSAIDPSALDVDEKELDAIRKVSRIMRMFMLGIATLMIITAWYNIGSSSTEVSDSFLAMYLFFFATLICCYELAIKRVAILIVQNFGFMYNAFGKMGFLLFVAFICFELSTMGKVCFALLLCYGVANIYVHFKHPQYPRYMRAMHFYARAKAKRPSPPETV